MAAKAYRENFEHIEWLGDIAEILAAGICRMHEVRQGEKEAKIPGKQLDSDRRQSECVVKRPV